MDNYEDEDEPDIHPINRRNLKGISMRPNYGSTNIIADNNDEDELKYYGDEELRGDGEHPETIGKPINEYLKDTQKIIEEAESLLERNYRQEYDRYQSRPEQKKRRAQRNKDRRKFEREGKVKKGDGRDIHHRDGNPFNHHGSNTAVISKSKNRSIRERTGPEAQLQVALAKVQYILDTLEDRDDNKSKLIKAKMLKFLMDLKKQQSVDEAKYGYSYDPKTGKKKPATDLVNKPKKDPNYKPNLTKELNQSTLDSARAKRQVQAANADEPEVANSYQAKADKIGRHTGTTKATPPHLMTKKQGKDAYRKLHQKITGQNI